VHDSLAFKLQACLVSLDYSGGVSNLVDTLSAAIIQFMYGLNNYSVHTASKNCYISY
jgi:hypothetical protein